MCLYVRLIHSVSGVVDPIFEQNFSWWSSFDFKADKLSYHVLLQYFNTLINTAAYGPFYVFLFDGDTLTSGKGFVLTAQYLHR